MNKQEYFRRLPKVDLHLHLAGTLQPRTVIELARKNGVDLPTQDEDSLYQFKDFYDFLDMLEIIGRCMITRDDFARVSYEALRDAGKAGNLRYAELFFNPQYHYPQGIDYATMVDGYIDGLEAAERDYGVTGRLIPSINRELGPGAAVDMMRDVIDHRRDHVIGIGMDCAEYKGKPHLFAEIYQMAKRAGLRRTAHVCEDNQTLEQAPPSHVIDCLEILDCDRLDHGYNMLADPAVVGRCRDCGVPCTVCSHTCVASRLRTRWDNISRMHEAGLNLVVCTDDPPMFGTDIGKAYVTVCEELRMSPAQAADLSLAGIDATWLSDDEKRGMRQRFKSEIDLLGAALDSASEGSARQEAQRA
ncbi:MAG: adenosine deaminase [Rhizobiaceae bacterium]